MSKEGKPTVVKDGVDFEQFKSVSMAPKEVDMTETAQWENGVVGDWKDVYEEEHYESQQQLHNQFDYNAKKNLKK